MPNHAPDCSCSYHRHVPRAALTSAEQRAAVGPSRLHPGSLEIHANLYTDSMRRRDEAARKATRPAAPKPQKAPTMTKHRAEAADTETRLANLEKRVAVLEKKLKVAPPEDEGSEGADARRAGITYKSAQAADLDRRMGLTPEKPLVRLVGASQVFNALTPEQARKLRGRNGARA